MTIKTLNVQNKKVEAKRSGGETS